MKVAIITDTHYGGKNDNLQFAQFQKRFYEGTFFPICKREGITTILHLGDVFDRRKYSNFNTLKLAKEMCFDPARDFKIHMLVGNHDAYFKNNNDVNTVTLTCAEYNNITVYKDIPELVEIGGCHILFVPWIASAHRAASLNVLNKAKAETSSEVSLDKKNLADELTSLIKQRKIDMPSDSYTAKMLSKNIDSFPMVLWACICIMRISN